MTAHNDVMRSDRLKQVMQEIDPNFDEKDAGFSRFSKFVIEAARRGLITLTRLDNGQYEIALGPQVEGAAAQPALTALAESNERAPAPRAEREGGRGGARRGGRARGGRGRSVDREEQPAASAEPAPPPSEQPEAPAAKAGFSFGDAFGLLKQAVGRIGVDEDQATPAAEEPSARDEEEAPRPVFQAPTRDTQEEEDDMPMPASSAPPPPYSTPSPSAPGTPMRGARFRRGSRGGGHRPAAGGIPEIPKIGVVEVDPNFRPRGDLIIPPAAQAPPPKPPVVGGGEPSERGGGRGGRGRGGRGRGENGERGERGGRGRRGGRGGRGRGPRRYESETTDITNQSSVESASPPPAAPAPPATAPVPPPAPAPPATATETESGESFWSKVKRGLTGGA